MNQLLTIIIWAFIRSWFQSGSLVILGEVYDAKSQEPVPYVNISFKQANGRLISNAEGIFRLTVPASSQTDTLVLSCIGFEPLAVPVKAFLHNQKSGKRLLLRESTATLQEVRVTPLNARQIIARGIAQIPDNYGGTTYQAEGFYRHAVKENGAFTSLIESVVQVYQAGFGARNDVDVTYQKSRLSQDYRQYRPAAKPNLMQNALALDHVRYGRGFLNQNNLGNWQFKITGYTQIDKQDVYIIKASIPTTRKADMHQATIYVRANDYAFLKVDYDYSWDTQQLAGEPFRADTLKYKKYSWRGTFSYAPYQNKLVLNYFHFTLKQKIYLESYVTVSSGNIKTTKDLASQELHEEFVVNNIRFVAPKEVNVEAKNKNPDLYQNAVSYDRAFWAQYQKPVDSKLYQEIKADLEKHAPLETQFGQAPTE